MPKWSKDTRMVNSYSRFDKTDGFATLPRVVWRHIHRVVYLPECSREAYARVYTTRVYQEVYTGLYTRVYQEGYTGLYTPGYTRRVLGYTHPGIPGGYHSAHRSHLQTSGETSAKRPLRLLRERRRNLCEEASPPP